MGDDCGKSFETFKALITHEETECGNDLIIEQDTEVCWPYAPLSVQDKEEVITEELVEDTPGITTEETVRNISDIDTKEIVEETPDFKIKEILPEITAEENEGDKQDTEVCRPYVPLSVQDEEEITTEEIVEVIQNDNLPETPEIEIQETSEKRLEELKAVMIDWMEFNFTEHKSEEEYLEAREKMIKIEEEKQITQMEWDKIWRMFVRKKKKERKKQS